MPDVASPGRGDIVESPREVAQGVYVIGSRTADMLVPNIGIVRGSDGRLVIDAGLGPANGRIVRAHADRIAPDGTRYVTLTHFHFEHSAGVQPLAQSSTLIYNREQRDEARSKFATALDTFRGYGDDLVPKLEGIALVEPDIAYERSADIDLGDVAVHLRSAGPAHSRGDQIIFLPGERVVFTGDLVENGVFPLFGTVNVDIDPERWIAALEHIEALDPAVVVPGHGPVGTVDMVAAARACLVELRQESLDRRRDGQPIEDAAHELRRDFTARHADWRMPEWIVHWVRYFYSRPA